MSKIMEKIYALFRMNILIFVLLLVTVIALFAYRNGLDDIVFLNLADYPYIIAQTDSVDGGSSAIAMERTDSSIIVDYELREGYAYPYAGVKIFLGDGKTRGKDLSRYDSIFVWVKPRGEGTVRLYMQPYVLHVVEEPLRVADSGYESGGGSGCMALDVADLLYAKMNVGGGACAIQPECDVLVVFGEAPCPARGEQVGDALGFVTPFEAYRLRELQAGIFEAVVAEDDIEIWVQLVCGRVAVPRGKYGAA